jgi:hypothetical protein
VQQALEEHLRFAGCVGVCATQCVSGDVVQGLVRAGSLTVDMYDGVVMCGVIRYEGCSKSWCWRWEWGWCNTVL